jgi:hypothetical protein
VLRRDVELLHPLAMASLLYSNLGRALLSSKMLIWQLERRAVAQVKQGMHAANAGG